MNEKTTNNEPKTTTENATKTVKKVTQDYENLNFNTAISQMMIFVNAVYKEDIFPTIYAKNFVKLLNPIAPFITEELWSSVFNNNETISI